MCCKQHKLLSTGLIEYFRSATLPARPKETAAPDVRNGRLIHHAISLVAASELDACNAGVPIEAPGRFHIF
jgi:hypothetical protein